MPSAVMPPTSVQYQQRTTSESSFSKLKHWFNKGSQMHGDNKASHQAKRKQQRDNGSARYVAGRKIHTADGAATRPYPISPRGPRLSPQAVHVEARSNTSEGDNVSIFSSLRSSPASSLTSTQSHVSPEQSQQSKARNPKPSAVPISLPQPRQSLLDLAANYADVQNPTRANLANEKPTPIAPVAIIKPLHKQDEQRPKEYRADQPIKEVPNGRAQVVTPPTHQRSQKTVVRKMVPERAPRTDNHPRQVYRETRFEDFMGKDSPPVMPPLPANVAGLAVPKAPADARLSRPFAFAVAKEYEEPVTEDARPGTASTAALSVTDPRAQTWLRYDGKRGESAQVQSTDAPLFPRRNPAVPDPDQQIKYNPCQTCGRQVHPSTAFSYNGTYLCENCAATGPWGEKKKEKLNIKKNKASRKPVLTPTAAAFPEKYTPAATLSTSSTLRSALSPKLSPRERRTDVTPGNAHGYLQSPKPSFPALSDPRFSTTTSRPQSPYFANPNAQGQYPRYRTPPAPPITTTNLPSDQLVSAPPTSPLRKPKPASSIYPSTPWRLSRPPSIPDIPDKFVFQGTEKNKERDTVMDIIDSYAAESPSPVSPLSDKLVEANGEFYVNAGWRTRKNMF
ncbi:MAG: hypothetical protein L6R42_003378 [Xanthoria sp. 1 TBL-2021]|nr:MAG: hypothetical protein L6R42_003378 [Xanthoria sp. 1 TBL-2021]